MTVPTELPSARMPAWAAGGGLLPRFARWAAGDPDAPALAAPEDDELRWTSRAGLLTAVLDRAARLDPSERAPVVVDPDQPVSAMVSLMAAEATGRAALLRSPDWDAATTRALTEQFTGEFGDTDRRRPLLVLPTSGSRLAPRAVVRTNRSWSAAVEPFSRFAGLAPGHRADRPAADQAAVVRSPARWTPAVWAPGSLASTLTLWAVWHALATGVPVLATGTWHPRWTGEVRRAHRPGYLLQAVPMIAEQVLDAAREDRRLAPAGIVVAGAAAPAELWARAAALRVPLGTYYGAAELSFVAARSFEHGPRKGRRTGGRPSGLRPFPGVSVRVRGGEIWARSPYTALGYLGAPGGATWRNGWVSVHDRGIRTADGELLVRGRGDTAATVGGTTVLTADVEATLADAPGLAEIVCLPEPDPVLGQRLVAVLRPARNSAAGQDSTTGQTGTTGHDNTLVPRLRELARQRLAPAARPARYVVLEHLPRTSAGKVARAALAREVTRDTAPVSEAG